MHLSLQPLRYTYTRKMLSTLKNVVLTFPVEWLRCSLHSHHSKIILFYCDLKATPVQRLLVLKDA